VSASEWMGSLSITPNTQQTHWQSYLSYCTRWFTVNRPRPFSLDVVVSDPLFVISNLPLQKSVDFVAIRWLKYGVWGFLALIYATPVRRISFFVSSFLFTWFRTVFCAMFGFWAIETVLALMVGLDDFHYFIDIFVEYDNVWTSTQ